MIVGGVGDISPAPFCYRTSSLEALKHVPQKWEPVLRKGHAQTRMAVARTPGLSAGVHTSLIASRCNPLNSSIDRWTRRARRLVTVFHRITEQSGCAPDVEKPNVARRVPIGPAELHAPVGPFGE